MRTPLSLPFRLGAALLAGVAMLRADAPARGADEPDRADPEVLSRAFAAAGRTIGPSVVQITLVNRLEADRDDPAANDLFRRFFGDEGGEGAPGPRHRAGEGSGVIVSEDGYIVTNHHVAYGADELQVRLADGREYTARLVGTDAESDIAVLRIAAGGLTAARLGDSSSVGPGDWVLAVGNPFGFAQTITAGIVSAVGRSNVGLAQYEQFIQTDAAVNPGNSGGPLVNLRGEVIGINTAISTRNGGYQGVSFAIPSNMVRAIFESIRDEGRVVRGWLGVQIQPLTLELARSFGFDGEGVIVADVLPGKPADQAEVRAGDIVTRIDGRPVRSGPELLEVVAQIRPGRRVDVDVFRGGRPRTIPVTFGERESRVLPLPEPPPPVLELGLAVETLTPGRAEELGLRGPNGVVVTTVRPGGAAERAGIRRGAVIDDVDGTPVLDAETFERIILDSNLRAGVRLRVTSPFRVRYAVVKLDQ